MIAKNSNGLPPGAKPQRLGGRVKLAALGGVVGGVAAIYYFYRDRLSLAYLAQSEAALRAYQSDRPTTVLGLAFLAYVLITGLSLPGASVMTLLMGWFFGFWPAVALVSFASTAGATMAFLLSRYFFRDAVQHRFGDRLKTFNTAFEREGAFYLLTLRLIPQVPFFLINVLMGMTTVRVSTYWWVSQLGMLPATMVYVYAGSRVPDLQTLANEGAGAVFSPSQLTQIAFAFILLAIFPIAIKKILNWVRPTPATSND